MARLSFAIQMIIYAVTLLSSVFAQERSVDKDLCYSSMMEADDDGDRKLSKPEYVTFLKLYGLPGIEEDDEYSDLPLVLQSTFLFLSCMCSSNGSSTSSCCTGTNPYLPNDGAASFEEATVEQTTYLFNICKVTESAIDQATPTSAPVVSTSAPTGTPSEATVSPTVSPTLSPTVSPTMSPTISPTLLPTKQPSSEPSARTLNPTVAPASPAPTIINNPTTMTYSQAPTVTSPVDAVIRTTYSISVLNGKQDEIEQSIYTQDLIGAMDIVASEVGVIVEEENESVDGITVVLPTKVVLLVDSEWSSDLLVDPELSQLSQPGLIAPRDFTACPALFSNPELDSCKQVTASIGLLFEEDEPNSEAMSNLFKSTLDREIAGGLLQDALSRTNRYSVVEIITGNDNVDDVRPSPSDLEAGGGLSTGGAIGIGAAGVILIAIFVMSVARSNKKKGPGRPDDGRFLGATPESGSGPGVVGSGLEWEAKPGDEESNMAENPWVIGGNRKGGSVVSHEDSAGWSDAYSSSMGTNESAEDQDLLDSDITENDVVKKVVPNMGGLEAAITAGDWAAVGASAALLAASQFETDSLSNSKNSVGIYSNGESTIQSLNKRPLDTEKTKELDDLIQTGDWAGVIQAAAKFEAEVSNEEQTATVFEDSDSRSDSRSDSKSGKSGSITSGSYFSLSINRTNSSTSAKFTGSEEEYRKEVHDLIIKVVPEELDHVDDMIAQFKGRENELIETLKTMQEREISQKAKKTERQKAKLDAKRMVAENKRSKSPSDNPSIKSSSKDDDDAAAAAAADWAIARSLASLEKQEGQKAPDLETVDDDIDEGSL